MAERDRARRPGRPPSGCMTGSIARRLHFSEQHLGERLHRDRSGGVGREVGRRVGEVGDVVGVAHRDHDDRLAGGNQLLRPASADRRWPMPCWSRRRPRRSPAPAPLPPRSSRRSGRCRCRAPSQPDRERRSVPPSVAVTLAPVTRTLLASLASGSVLASSFTRVTVESVICCARAWWAAVPTRICDLRLVDEDVLLLEEAALHLQLQHPVTDWSMRFSVSSPEPTASSTAW